MECSSGWTYAERPAALHWNGERLAVIRVEQLWRGPQGRHFIVQTSAEQRFELIYHEAEDRWTARPF